MTIEIADLPPSKWWFSEGRSSPKAIRQARPTPKARELKTEAEVIAPRPPEAGRSPVGLDISMIFGWDFGWFSDEIFVDFWWDFWGSSTGFWMILDEIFVDFWWDFWGSSTGFWMILDEIFDGFLMGFLRIFHGILDDSQWDFQFFAMLRWIFGSCSQCREEVEPLVRQPGGELIVQEISRDDPFMWYCTTTTVIFEVQNGYSMPRIVDNTYL